MFDVTILERDLRRLELDLLEKDPYYSLFSVIICSCLVLNRFMIISLKLWGTGILSPGLQAPNS